MGLSHPGNFCIPWQKETFASRELLHPEEFCIPRIFAFRDANVQDGKVFWPLLHTCATIEETSPVLEGRIRVLLVLASSWNALTYFSATASAAALDPLVWPNALDTSSMDWARALPAAITASAEPWASLINCCFSASEILQIKISPSKICKFYRKVAMS